MTLRAKILWTLAVVSVGLNGFGAIYALPRGEWLHGGTHVALLALTVYLIAIFRPRTQPIVGQSFDVGDDDVPLGDSRMEQLQQSVDAIAVEVERIGEAQRYNAKLQAKEEERSSGPR